MIELSFEFPRKEQSAAENDDGGEKEKIGTGSIGLRLGCILRHLRIAGIGKLTISGCWRLCIRITACFLCRKFHTVKIGHFSAISVRRHLTRETIRRLDAEGFQPDLWKQLLYHREKWVSPAMETTIRILADRW